MELEEIEWFYGFVCKYIPLYMELPAEKRLFLMSEKMNMLVLLMEERFLKQIPEHASERIANIKLGTKHLLKLNGCDLWNDSEWSERNHPINDRAKKSSEDPKQKKIDTLPKWKESGLSDDEEGNGQI